MMSWIGLILSLLALALPFALYLLKETKPPGLLIATFVLTTLLVERFYFSLMRSREEKICHIEGDWTVVAVAYSYILMIYIVIYEIYISKSTFNLFCFLFGMVFVVASLVIRWWAAKSLGDQWAIHVDSDRRRTRAPRTLITSGPYRHIRHPIYSAAILEILSIPIAFGSLKAFMISLLVGLPLQITRAFYEEKYLYNIFGQDYKKYSLKTPRFVPRTISIFQSMKKK